jgi:hypothetical protein
MLPLNPQTFSLVQLYPPSLPLSPVSKYSIQFVAGREDAKDHILQEFNTLHLARLRTYKIAGPPQTKP